MRKWIPLVLIALSFVGSALLLPHLPAIAEFKLDGLFPVTAESDSGPRWQLAFLMPLIALSVWLGLRLATTAWGAAINQFLFGRWVPSPALEPTAFDRFRPTYDFTVTLVVSFVLLFHFTVLGLAAGGPGWLTRAFTALVGVGMMALGNVMPRVRPNAVMGVRTIRTLNDPLLWARVHRLLGGLIMVSGLIMVGLTLVAPRYALVCGMAGLLAACFAVFIYTRTSSGQRSAVVLLLVCVALSAWEAVAVAQTPMKADTILPADVIETALTLQSGALKLNGTLALPARRTGRIPMLVIAAGSGPTDRNGQWPAGADQHLSFSGLAARAAGHRELPLRQAWPGPEHGTARSPQDDDR